MSTRLSPGADGPPCIVSSRFVPLLTVFSLSSAAAAVVARMRTMMAAAAVKLSLGIFTSDDDFVCFRFEVGGGGDSGRGNNTFGLGTLKLF